MISLGFVVPAIAVAAATLGVACANDDASGSEGAASGQTLSLQGAYVATDANAGAYRAIVFTDDVNYFGYLAGCAPDADTEGCRRAGTYTTTSASVVLTDEATSASETLSFRVLSTAAITEASLEAEAITVHLDGLVMDGGTIVGDGGKLVGDGGALVCSAGALVHPTQVSVAGSTMNRVGGTSDGTSATFCDPSHATTDCAAQGASTTTTTATTPSACQCANRSGGATPACPADAGSMATSASPRPSGGPGMQTGDGPSSGGCSGKSITFDYQGSCDFLHRCDSYSKKLPVGQVEWGCLGHGDTCRDADFWISVPGHSLCGHSYKFCKGGRCVTARALDVSNAGVYEASQGVLDALGIPYGGGESSCHGTYIGSSDGKIDAKATLCSSTN